MTEPTAESRADTAAEPAVAAGPAPQPESPPAPQPESPRGWAARCWPTVAAAGVFLVVAVWSQGSVWAHGLAHLTTSRQDGEQTQWFFSWVAFCVLHGHDPLLTHWVNVPQGANLLVNTSTLFLAALFVPLTSVAGATVAVNVAFTLAVAATAFTTYLMARRFTTWWPAALAAGLLAEVSAYMVGQGGGHLDLTFMAIPPLVVVVLDAIVVRQQGRAAWWGLALAALVVAQFFTSTEVLASTALFSVAGIVVLAITARRQVRAHLAYAARAIGWAAGATAVVLAVPVRLLLTGPQHLPGPVQPVLTIDSFRADLLGVLVPTTDQRFSAGLGVYGATHLAGGNNSENGAYLGALLVAVVLLLAWRSRKVGVVQVAAVSAAVAWVLSLGPRLTVLGHDVGVPLPFTVLTHLPLLDSMFSVRLTYFVTLFVALAFAVGLDGLHGGWPWGAGSPAPRATHGRAAHAHAHARARAAVPPERPVGRGWRRAAVLPTTACLGLAVVALVPLVPAWPYAASPVDAVPAYFTGPGVQRIAPASVVATYPFSYVGPGQAPIAPDASVMAPMLWQAAAHMRFRLVGGYVIVPAAPGTAGGAGGAYAGPPSTTRDVLTADYYGWAPPGAAAADAAQSRRELRSWGVGTVVADAVGADPAAALSYLTTVLGAPPVRQGGVYVWYGVPSLLARAT